MEKIENMKKRGNILEALLLSKNLISLRGLLEYHWGMLGFYGGDGIQTSGFNMVLACFSNSNGST